MFETFKSKVFSYFFYNFSSYSYRKVYEVEGKETLYYKNGKVVVFVEDTQLGEKIYELVKRLKENTQVIKTSAMDFQIVSYYLSSENTIQAFCAYIDWKEAWLAETEWEYMSNLKKLTEMVEFIEKMEGEYGYSLNSSRFEKRTSKQLATFLSFFDIESEERNSSKGYLIEYIHYVLFGGENLQATYESLLKQDFIPITSFPYRQPIIYMCYQYFTQGIVVSNISEVLEREQAYQQERYIRCYYIANISGKTQVVEETGRYVVYNDNCKIYKYHSGSFANFLQHILEFSENYDDFVAENILSEIRNFEGNVIGYHYAQSHSEDVSFREASVIFDITKKQSDFLLKLRKRLKESDEGEATSGFNFETDVVFHEMYHYYVGTYEDLFNLRNTSVETLKEQIALAFLKRYTEFLKQKYGKLTKENEFLTKWEVRNLIPALANAIIQYALGNKVNLCETAKELYTIFTQNVLIEENSGYLYDKRFAYHPKKVPFFFEDEAEKKYALPIEKGTQHQLPDSRQFVVLQRRMSIAKLQAQIDSRRRDLNQRFGPIEYKYLKITTISEVIYSRDIASDGTYCVVGYITTPIKGKRLTKEGLLGLNNKEMYYLIGHLVAKFAPYCIPLDTVWMDKDGVCYINLFDSNLQIRKVSNVSSPNWFIDELKKEGYNPNAFYGTEYVRTWHELADSCNKYCKEHGIYYEGKKGLCPVCQKTKAVVILGATKKLWKDETASYYELPNGSKVKAYRKNDVDKQQKEKNVDQILARRLDSRLDVGQECFVPYKKAISIQNKFIGYIYEDGVRANGLEDTAGCIDIAQTAMLSNLPRLKSLIRLMLQVQELVMHGWSFTKNPFTHNVSGGGKNPVGHVFLSKGHKQQVQILNIDLLSRTGNAQDTFKWTCEYVCLILALDKNIEIDTSNCQENFQELLSRMQTLGQRLTKYCPVHHMYYDKQHLFCPKCIPEESQNLTIERINKRDVISQTPVGEGGESIIYPYRD
ncbi:MAG: hypothetical protein HFJ28_06980, partial [Clostridia bacterium]|nr:hypothetical protein [Clostridia bacterium]